jgi:hypothetical protein
MAGRNSKLTPDRQTAICTRLRKGDDIKVAAEASGVKYSTHWYWVGLGKKDEKADVASIYRDYYVAVTQALAECESGYTTVLAKAAAGWEEVTTKSTSKVVMRVIEELDERGRVVRRIREPVTVVLLDTIKTNKFDWRPALEVLARRFRERWGANVKIDPADLPDDLLIKLLAESTRTRGVQEEPEAPGPADGNGVGAGTGADGS